MPKEQEDQDDLTRQVDCKFFTGFKQTCDSSAVAESWDLRKSSNHVRVADDKSKTKARAISVLRPRAVLSSPENDEVIGNKNRLLSRKSSALRRQCSDECSSTKARTIPNQVKVKDHLSTNMSAVESGYSKSSIKQPNSIVTAIQTGKEQAL